MISKELYQKQNGFKFIWEILVDGGTFTKIFMITIQGYYELKKQLITPGHFVLNSESDFAHISTPGSLTDSSMNLGSRIKGFLMVPNFP